jgi:hypothetical protein
LRVWVTAAPSTHVGAVSLTVTGSTFRHNQAIGGSGCFSPILSGHGSGGAIGSQGALTVSDSRFDHNLAIAGENNTTALPSGFGPNKATAGAINISGGEATIEGCTFEHNQAIGGAGGIGSGGGIVVTDVVAALESTPRSATARWPTTGPLAARRPAPGLAGDGSRWRTRVHRGGNAHRH